MLHFDGAIRADPSVIPIATQEPWPEAKQRFCQFDLKELLGVGGASRVFLASQLDAGGRTVVLKICSHGMDEAGLLGTFKSRGIADIHFVATDTKSGYSGICMPFYSRVTVGDLVSVVQESGSDDPMSGQRLRQIVDLSLIHI